MSARGVAWVAALLGLGAPAGAATFCVNPGGTGGCSNQIQLAVSAAGPGDIVKVQPGIYFENVVVPSGKDGLQILGANRLTTILDPDAPNSGQGFGVVSNGVQIKNLTIRNGRSAFSVAIVGGAAVVQGVRIVGCRGTPGSVYAGSAILVGGGSGHQIIGNEIRSCRYGVYFLSGPTSSIVKGNTIVGAGVAGVVVAGPSATNPDIQILSNKISNTPIGIEVNGDTSTISGNVIENAQVGVESAGVNPVVQANRLISAGAVLADCTTCTGGGLKSNSVLGSLLGFAVRATADEAGFVAQGNKISQVAGAGMFVTGNTVQVTQNSVADTGGVGGPGSCFMGTGVAHTFKNNTAIRCGGAGFYMNGDDMSLISNSATGATTFGFVMDGNSGGIPYTNAAFSTNKALSSVGQGFAVINGAMSSTLTGNSSSHNRLDYCGLGAPLAGNAFTVQSPTCDVLQ